jgi:hypothetical protein
MLRINVKRSVAATLVGLLLAVVVAEFDGKAQQEKPAEEVYKNIQIFKGLPAPGVMRAMNFFTRSLGVDCTHCHVPGEFEKDDKPAKQTARKMYRMVRLVMKELGTNNVSCYTCHRGQPQPVSFPPAAESTGRVSPEVKAAPGMPAVAEVLDRYVRAVGGKTALEKLSTRVLKGWLVAQGGLKAPLEIYEKAPNKMLIVFQIPGNPSTVGFDGAMAWEKNQQNGVREMKGGEVDFVRRTAEFHKEMNLSRLYPRLEAKGQAKLGERQAYVIDATSAAGSLVRLYFDADTGLLVRQDFEMEGPQGKMPMQIYFEDYRVVDGVKLPFVRRWERAGFTFTQKVDEITHNVAIDDARFAKPAAP